MKKPTSKTAGAGSAPRPKSASRRSRPSGGRPGVGTPPLPNEWSEFLRSLSAHRVRFLVVGAHALAAHGLPRYTADLDVLVDPTPANARRLGAALTEFGFEALGRAYERFAEPDRMARLGVEPLRIDVMTSITGVSFREAWAGRLVVVLNGLPIPFLGKAEFARNKRASGRPKDLADLSLLAQLTPSSDAPGRGGANVGRTPAGGPTPPRRVTAASPPRGEGPPPKRSPKGAAGTTREAVRAEAARERRARGLRTAVLDLCEVFDIEPTEAQRARLKAMGVSELEALRRELKQAKRWPA
jgi:hypothetical protein